jgi:hypothetical protein
MSGISSALGLGAIMNVFEDTGRDGGRSPKFPKELLTALGTKLQNIAMNRDPGYERTTQTEKNLISIFLTGIPNNCYGAQWRSSGEVYKTRISIAK